MVAITDRVERGKSGHTDINKISLKSSVNKESSTVLYCTEAIDNQTKTNSTVQLHMGDITENIEGSVESDMNRDIDAEGGDDSDGAHDD